MKLLRHRCCYYDPPYSFVFLVLAVASIATGFLLPLQQKFPTTPTRMFASRNADGALTSAAPLYITVGPQCCGKTTFLQTQHDHKILDISLDDQPDVYVPVDTALFLDSSNNSTLLQAVYQGKSLAERIQQDNTELTLILKRWRGDLSAQNFAISVLQLYQQQGHSVHVAQGLVRIVEDYYTKRQQQQQQQESNNILPAQVQVFCLESLFRPHPTTNQSAIQRAHKLLRTTPTHIPVAWGNTNSKPKDYQMALEIACQTRRPVHFVMSAPYCNPTSIPWVSLSTLLLRNLQRLSETGKYVPASAIADCYRRIDQLFAGMPTTTDGMAMETDSPPRKMHNGDATFAMEQYLVQLAEPRHGNGNSTYRYRLTRNRLIQKEFGSSSAAPGDVPSNRVHQQHNENGNGGPPQRNSTAKRDWRLDNPNSSDLRGTPSWPNTNKGPGVPPPTRPFPGKRSRPFPSSSSHHSPPRGDVSRQPRMPSEEDRRRNDNQGPPPPRNQDFKRRRTEMNAHHPQDQRHGHDRHNDQNRRGDNHGWNRNYRPSY